MSQHLKQIINDRSISLGSTPTGAQWCLKALHPSDPETEVRGIPDPSSVPSVLMNYQSTFTLHASATATGVWSFDAQVIPHPVGMISALRDDSVGLQQPLEFLNSQLAGNTHAAKFASFISQFKRWRLAYMGVTVHQDGPALSDQGTIVVCQPPVAMTTHSLCSWYAASPGLVCNPPVSSLKLSDLPSFDASQSLPNSYLANSRDGVYIPLKLTQTDQRWYSMTDAMFLGLDRRIESQFNATDSLVLPTNTIPTGTGGYYPFLSLAPAHVLSQTSGPNGDLTSPPLNDQWANVSVRNASVNSSFTFFVRLGLECQCGPGSIMSPQQRISPPYDFDAIKAYYAIAREMKDAYPADYNDLGKLWNVIRGVALNILPKLKAIPHPVAQGLASVGDVISLLPESSSREPRAESTAPQVVDKPKKKKLTVTRPVKRGNIHPK